MCPHVTTGDNIAIGLCTISYRAGVYVIIGYPVKRLIKLGIVSDVVTMFYTSFTCSRARRPHPFRINVTRYSAAPIIKYLPLARINVCLNKRSILSRAVFTLSAWIIFYSRDIILLHAIQWANIESAPCNNVRKHVARYMYGTMIEDFFFFNV